MSVAPAISIVEDLQAAIAQFAEIASDLKKKEKEGSVLESRQNSSGLS
jgi:hypothetical protein